MDAYHQTIHLSINKGVGNSWNLAWTDYIGFDINTYTIYRKTDTSEFVLIGSISASFNSYTDFDAPETDVYYVVEAENPNVCGGLLKAGGIYVTRSNMVTNSSLGISDRELDLFQTIYPNPASKFVTIEPHRGVYGKAVLMLTDISGKIVYREEYSAIHSQDRITLDVSGLENGIYLLSMRSSASSSSAKVVVSH